jgi:hypothetical protein
MEDSTGSSQRKTRKTKTGKELVLKGRLFSCFLN